MNQLLAILLTCATAVHSVFGCCWHDALMAADVGEQSKQPAATSCSCHFHSHTPSKKKASRDASEPSNVAAARDSNPVGLPSGNRPAPDHECHNSKCVSLLSEQAPDVGNSDGRLSVGATPATVTVQIGSIEFPLGSAEHFLDSEATRPIRAHLLLRVLLI
jgi:hypothetical protein